MTDASTANITWGAPQPPAADVVKNPTAVSKSAMRAMGCETHYANYYLLRNSPFRLIESPLAKTGTDFHRWRADYTNYLLENGMQGNKEWARTWLISAVITEDARRLIEDDLETYSIDPEAVFAVEMFLSIGPRGEPVEMQIGSGTPGRISTDPRAMASGSLDILEIRGTSATVADYKSGWATATVSDVEPPVYAALVFAHFPQVQEVTFRWEFIRLRAEKSAVYRRDQMPVLLDTITAALKLARDIAVRFPTDELTVNPWAGLCGFCELRCPLRAAASSLRLMVLPVQTEEDARTMGAVLYAATQIASRARTALKGWLADRGSMQLNEDFVLEMATQFKSKRPLLESLEVLGYDVSAMREKPGSPKFDVPTERLTLGGTTSYAKAKKRAGLPEQLDAISVRTPSTKIQIRRMSEGEALLNAADNEAEDQ